MQTPSQPRPFPESSTVGGSVRPARDAQDPGSAQPVGLMKAMSPGVVDFLFRQLVEGRPPVDIQWQDEGVTLTAQPAGAELARRLADTDLDALTPTELFHYVRAAQRLAAWAEGLREAAVDRYCQPGKPQDGVVPSARRASLG
ncbi:hypothetical protein [Arthrobacter sp. Soil762]|uniref:hypothetical protein n=1 Tax=Arthrobacter sp. Soil762 TaxID=1736401 RepID=UPI001F2C24CE|nr:hypothetical protein [Arthrobacter sp. Soil762]